MARLKDELTERGVSVYVQVTLGSSDKYLRKSGSTYQIQLKADDARAANSALINFMSHELHVGIQIESGLADKLKKVYISTR